MTRPLWLPDHIVPTARVLPFPTVNESQAAVQSELGGALCFASPDNLILQITSLLNWVVHHKDSLGEDRTITLLGDLLAMRETRLRPWEHEMEVHRAFLSDISAKAARKRRRRQRRVKEQDSLSA